jgi:hypothetical protein
VTSVSVDLLGIPLTGEEMRLIDVYDELKVLCAEDLDPVAAANVRAALALMHNAVCSLGLVYEHLSDLEV